MSQISPLTVRQSHSIGSILHNIFRVIEHYHFYPFKTLRPRTDFGVRSHICAHAVPTTFRQIWYYNSDDLEGFLELFSSFPWNTVCMLLLKKTDGILVDIETIIPRKI